MAQKVTLSCFFVSVSFPRSHGEAPVFIKTFNYQAHRAELHFSGSQWGHATEMGAVMAVRKGCASFCLRCCSKGRGWQMRQSGSLSSLVEEVQAVESPGLFQTLVLMRNKLPMC